MVNMKYSLQLIFLDLHSLLLMLICSPFYQQHSSSLVRGFTTLFHIYIPFLILNLGMTKGNCKVGNNTCSEHIKLIIIIY